MKQQNYMEGEMKKFTDGLNAVRNISIQVIEDYITSDKSNEWLDIIKEHMAKKPEEHKSLKEMLNRHGVNI